MISLSHACLVPEQDNRQTSNRFPLEARLHNQVPGAGLFASLRKLSEALIVRCCGGDMTPLPSFILIPAASHCPCPTPESCTISELSDRGIGLTDRSPPLLLPPSRDKLPNVESRSDIEVDCIGKKLSELDASAILARALGTAIPVVRDDT